MNSYLMIQNVGEAPIEGYTVLGASTTRHSDAQGVIGRFGSGNKHAVNLLLRHSLMPTVFCGNLRLAFSSEPDTINDGVDSCHFGRIVCHVSGRTADGKTHNKKMKLSYALEYGADDWQEMEMALREFVCNAIDRTIKEYPDFLETIIQKDGISNKYGLEIRIVNDNQVRAKSGHTRIFIPLTPAVHKYYQEIPKRFLHFSEPHLLKRKILPKGNRQLDDSKHVMIYKNGVYVRSIRQTSLFDYNLSNELQLDECRNINDYTATGYVATTLQNSEPEVLAAVFRAALEDRHVFEIHASNYMYFPSNEEIIREMSKKWTKGWETVAPGCVLCFRSETNRIEELLRRKGHAPRSVSRNRFCEKAMEFPEFPSYSKVLSTSDIEGRTPCQATPAAIQALHSIWTLLGRFGMTKHKVMPMISGFVDVANAASKISGFQEGDTIYIEHGLSSGPSHELLKTILEEVTHYVTGSTDCSRDFQEFLLQFSIYASFGDLPVFPDK